MCFYLSVKIEKNTKYIQVFEKVTQLATRALVAGRKKEKISKSEMTTLTYFDNLKKKKNKINAVKTGVTEGFISLTISNFRTTAFCFEYFKLLK